MEILRGDQPAGADIREGEFAQRFGTSKTPVREALARLRWRSQFRLQLGETFGAAMHPYPTAHRLL